jgi:hypothetical protein
MMNSVRIGKKKRNTIYICTYLWHQIFFCRRLGVKIHCHVGLVAKLGEQLGHSGESPPIRIRQGKYDICWPSRLFVDVNPEP